MNLKQLKSIYNFRYMLYLWLGCFLLTLFLAYIWNFMADDSFISFRYALHLEQGYGLVWNIGESPIEGYSNFLWVFLMAIILFLNLDPVLSTKIIGLIFLVLIIFLFWKFSHDIFDGERKSTYLGFSLAAVFFMANPATAIHTVSGMETMFYCFAVFLLTYFTYNIINSSQKKYHWFFAVTALISSLIRPEGILISFSLILLILYNGFKRNRSFQTDKSFITTIILLFLTPLIIYMLFRLLYFHEIFPMSFQAKALSHTDLFGNIIKNISRYAAALRYIAPFIVVSLVILFYNKLSSNKTIQKKLIDLFLIGLVSIISLNITYLFTNLAMNFGDRLFYPSYIIIYFLSGIALALIFKNTIIITKKRTFNKYLKCFLELVIVLLLVIGNIYFIPDMTSCQGYGDSLFSSQVPIGKALEPFSGSNLTVATDYAGAIPYYSKWRHIDMLGLNDKVIAKNPSPSQEYLEKVKPNLIIIPYSEGKFLFLPFLEYAQKYNYELIYTEQKSENTAFYYYLDPDITNYQEIKESIVSVLG